MSDSQWREGRWKNAPCETTSPDGGGLVINLQGEDVVIAAAFQIDSKVSGTPRKRRKEALGLLVKKLEGLLIVAKAAHNAQPE